MANLFLDCGTHLFQGFDQFQKMYNINSEWDCYSFEANPITYNLSRNNYNDLINKGFNITHLNVAVSNKYEEIKINCALSPEGDSYTNQGSNILGNPPSIDKVYGGKFDYNEESMTVNTINFSDFLSKVHNDSEFVLIKMDIEGSEFNVLDELIDSGNYKLINEIYIEFHERFFDDADFYREKKENYKKTFEKAGIIFHEWH